MFTISVAMIVRDEEPTMDRILTCIKSFADEIIIVDTGSIDKTKDIAYRFTDNVYDFEWCDDFAKARNFAFSKATKDYTMWLDADDYISELNINKIIKLKNSNEDADVYMFKYSIGDNFVFFRERLLKTANKYKWNGAVHEAISPSGKIIYKDIIIEHKKIKTNNPRRNLNIYNKLIQEGKDFSPREQYYYARELFYNRHYSKCIRELKKYLKQNDQYTPNILGAYIMLADTYSILNKPNLAIKYLLESLSRFIPTSELCCKLADCFEKINNISLCRYWYETALLCPKQEQGFINKDYQTFIPAIELCRLYYSINRTLSKKYFDLSKTIKPNHPSVIYNEQFFK